MFHYANMAASGFGIQSAFSSFAMATGTSERIEVSMGYGMVCGFGRACAGVVCLLSARNATQVRIGRDHILGGMLCTATATGLGMLSGVAITDASLGFDEDEPVTSLESREVSRT